MGLGEVTKDDYAAAGGSARNSKLAKYRNFSTQVRDWFQEKKEKEKKRTGIHHVILKYTT